MDRKDKDFTRSIWLPLLPLALACAAVSVPLLYAHLPVLALALQRGFSLVCHQHADRSFSLFGGSVAVCARCLGIYLGAAAGLLVRLPRQLALRFFLAALAVNAIDGLAEFAGMHGNWMLLRFSLGFALGTAAAMLVAASIIATEIPVANTSPIGNGGTTEA
ncbi:MAG TPA: DUF2085 domain-containing protein [Candidatus Methylomirabilis sp.]|nr:DUF2085 domain-containing protein [Candidatus Methylomirabilis sp.]